MIYDKYKHTAINSKFIYGRRNRISMCEVSEFIEALETGSNSEAISEMYDVCQIMQGLLTQYKKCNRYEIEVGNTIHQHKIDKYIEEKKHDFKYNIDI